MIVFRDTWHYLTTWSNWTGDAGMLHLMQQQLLLTVTALLLALAVGLPLALWLGHLGRGGFLAINITNIGRAIPTFPLLAVFVTADFPGVREFGRPEPTPCEHADASRRRRQVEGGQAEAPARGTHD